MKSTSTENVSTSSTSKTYRISLYDMATIILYLLSVTKSWYSSDGIATGWMTRVQFLAEERDISLLHSNQTGSGAIYPPIQWISGALFPEEKPTTHLHPVPRPRMAPALPHTSSWCGA
jgi:hypothetical protein